ncbi:hypothetical protein R1sor_000303 [Riccia sorocarpa]|uniref:Transposase n=1 Tax=Riccia sorocarpa TaxID=122646 RepID=A0ABD3GUE3_9MARC
MVALDLCHTKNKKCPTATLLMVLHMDAVFEELPTNEHIHCAHHLQVNIRRHCGAQVSKFFQRFVYVTSKGKYDEALKILEEQYLNGKEAVEYIRAIDARKFARYALELPRYGMVVSNAVECMNAVFLKLRVYTARQLIFELWTYMRRIRRFYEQRLSVEQSIERLTVYAKGRLSDFERDVVAMYSCDELVKSKGEDYLPYVNNIYF